MRKEFEESQEPSVIVAIDLPNKNSRTGHAAIKVDGKCYSLYHDTTAREVRLLPFGHFPRAIVPSLEDDQIMRGQSWEKRAENAGNAELPVSELLKQLPTSQKDKEYFYIKGKYQHIFELPGDTVDAYTVRKELDRIIELGRWSMFGPYASFLLHKIEAHNCCSAIQFALEKGKIKGKHTIPELAQLLLWLCYFAMLATEDQKENIIYSPLLLLLYQALVAAKNGFNYATDFVSMEKKPGTASTLLVFSVYAVCITANIIGSMYNENVCATAFLFPAHLHRQIQNIPGANRIEEIAPPLPQGKL